MSNYERMVEGHIREYETRLLHQEEMHEEPIRFAGPVSPLNVNWKSEEIAHAGPMGIWDAVALSIEGFVEEMEQ